MPRDLDGPEPSRPSGPGAERPEASPTTGPWSAAHLWQTTCDRKDIAFLIGLVSLLLALLVLFQTERDLLQRSEMDSPSAAGLGLTVGLWLFWAWLTFSVLLGGDDGPAEWARQRRVYVALHVALSVLGPLSLAALFIDPPGWTLVLSFLLACTFSVLWCHVMDRVGRPGEKRRGLLVQKETNDMAALAVVVAVVFVMPAAFTSASRFQIAAEGTGALELVAAVVPAVVIRVGSSEEGGEDEGCSNEPGAGAPDDEIRDLIVTASEEGADEGYGCLGPVSGPVGGSYVATYDRGPALVVASALGAGVLNGPALTELSERGGGQVTFGALLGQVLNQFDCGSAADVQPLVVEGHVVVAFVSRAQKFQGTEPAVVFSTPSALIDPYFAAMRAGQRLVAVGDAGWNDDEVSQRFVDIDAAPGGAEVVLRARATRGFVDRSVVDVAHTVDVLFRACNPGQALPPDLAPPG